MEYRYKSDVKAVDFWKLSMHHTYHSVAGVCNIVFTAAMILLTVKFWNQSDDFVRSLLVLGCLLFPGIQPMCVYAGAKNQAAAVPQNMELVFTESGMQVSVGAQTQNICWKDIKSVKKERNMLIVCSDAQHGYMITNRMLGKEKDSFWMYLQSHLK